VGLAGAPFVVDGVGVALGVGESELLPVREAVAPNETAPEGVVEEVELYERLLVALGLVPAVSELVGDGVGVGVALGATQAFDVALKVAPAPGHAQTEEPASAVAPAGHVAQPPPLPLVS